MAQGLVGGLMEVVVATNQVVLERVAAISHTPGCRKDHMYTHTDHTYSRVSKNVKALGESIVRNAEDGKDNEG